MEVTPTRKEEEKDSQLFKDHPSQVFTLDNPSGG